MADIPDEGSIPNVPATPVPQVTPGKYGLTHPDGSPCDAQKKENCPKYKESEQKDKGDDLSPKTSSAAKPVAEEEISLHDYVKSVFRTYRHDKTKSDKWLCKKLDITDSTKRTKVENALHSWVKGKKDKKEVVKLLESLSGKTPSSSPGKAISQGVLPLSGGWGNNLRSGNFSSSTPSSQWSGYYHAQGTRQVSNDLHKPTGLYKTKRGAGEKALAREEDVTGLNPFNKNRPQFVEHGDVPPLLTDQELAEFRYTSNGSTYPMVGNINGRNYIVKRGILPHGLRKNDDLQDHIRYEVAADRFIREAGLNAPVCTTFERKIPPRKPAIKIDETVLKDLFDKMLDYRKSQTKVDDIYNDDNATMRQYKDALSKTEQAKADMDAFGKKLGKDKSEYVAEIKERHQDGVLLPKGQADHKELVKIAEYVDGGVSLLRTWKEGSKATKAKIRQQVIDSYPIISFLMNTDAFKNDNVLCDSDDNLWFIDNGACFDYRAQGGKKLLAKDGDGWDILASSSNKDAKPWYFERTDPTDYYTGYLGLLYDPGQKLLQEILADVDDQELVDAAKKYNFTKLVETLPSEIKNRGTMRQYAKKLDEVIANPPKDWLAEEE